MRKGVLPVLLLVLGSCNPPSQQPQTQTCCPAEDMSVVVSIDSQLKAHPDPVHARRGSWMHFLLTPGAGELDLQTDFLEAQGHEAEHAWGRVKNDAGLGHHHYKVGNLKTQKWSDPDVMIDP